MKGALENDYTQDCVICKCEKSIDPSCMKDADKVLFEKFTRMRQPEPEEEEKGITKCAVCHKSGKPGYTHSCKQTTCDDCIIE